MANKEWDNATTDQRLEMLRKDISDISNAHNLLAQDHTALQGAVLRLSGELEQIRQKIAKE